MFSDRKYNFSRCKDTFFFRFHQIKLLQLGFGENIGSSFPIIIAAWKENGWGEPELKNKIGHFASYLRHESYTMFWG